MNPSDGFEGVTPSPKNYHTAKEWGALGFTIRKGAVSHRRSGGIALFHRSQVWQPDDEPEFPDLEDNDEWGMDPFDFGARD